MLSSSVLRALLTIRPFCPNKSFSKVATTLLTASTLRSDISRAVGGGVVRKPSSCELYICSADSRASATWRSRNIPQRLGICAMASVLAACTTAWSIAANSLPDANLAPLSFRFSSGDSIIPPPPPPPCPLGRAAGDPSTPSRALRRCMTSLVRSSWYSGERRLGGTCPRSRRSLSDVAGRKSVWHAMSGKTERSDEASDSPSAFLCW
mmetsp:Transcript_29976/g.97602  ORF Transcript_29976/g.97602 Transcript_29976/m.97602 type:complete len:208 (-) Transcript_29976:61-684(-)